MHSVSQITWGTMALMAFVTLWAGSGLVAALSVWLSSKKQQIPVTGFGLKSTAQTIFWIAPALGVVALIAMYKHPAKMPDTSNAVAEHTERDPSLLWSRQQVTDAPNWAKEEPETNAAATKKAGVPTKPISLVRRVLGDDQVPAIVVSTDPYATEEEAVKELTPRVVEAVTEELRAGFPVPGNWQVPVKLIATEGITSSENLVLEQFDKDFGLGKPDKMYRLHCRVSLTPQLRDVVYRDWRTQVVTYRLARLGGGMGVIVALTAILSMYLGLNAATQGLYRWRLRFAAASGLSVLALAVGLLLFRS